MKFCHEILALARKNRLIAISRRG